MSGDLHQLRSGPQIASTINVFNITDTQHRLRQLLRQHNPRHRLYLVFFFYAVNKQLTFIAPISKGAALPRGSMSSKRELSDVDEGEVSEPDPKRAKKQTGAMPRHQHQNSSIDPTWGQKYVFSSLQDATTIPYGEESDFEDDADAMAYLLSVRYAHKRPCIILCLSIGNVCLLNVFFVF